MIAFPSNPDIGDIHTFAKRSWIWNGNAWQSSNYRPDGAIVADTPPSNPEAGWLWWDRINAKLYTWTGAQWVEPNTNTTFPWDDDAAAYITKVEFADGQELEDDVRIAINKFVIDCKTDGNWTAIKASCLLAGARSLEGALIPLVGVAPTNSPTNANFTSADYDRKTGLKTDGSKYLITNYDNGNRIIDSTHSTIYLTEITTVNYRWYFGNSGAVRALGSQDMGYASGGTIRMYGASTGYLTKTHSTGFLGINRTDLNTYTSRTAGSTTSSTKPAEAPESYNIPVFTVWDHNYKSYGSAATNGRISFYSIGEGLADMTLFNTRLSTLMSELNAAIL